MTTAHLTASAAVFDNDRRLLLVHHNRYQCWVVPGGHVESDESPDQCAIREVFEETGIHIEIASAVEMVALPGADSLPVPIIVAAIPHPGKPERGEGPHTHIDMLYLAVVAGGDLTALESEVGGVTFASWDDLAELDVRDDVPHLFEACLAALS